jgi:DNA polymerase III subunit beta
MQITIEPSAFSSALYKLLGVASSKGPLNIVSNALITATDDGTVRLEGTDLEVSVATTLPCEVTRPGQLCLNAHNLHSVVKGLDAKKAHLNALDNHWAHLKAGDVECRIVGVPPVEFPKLPTAEDVESVSLDTGVLLDLIERTIFAISTDEGRPNLMGAFLELSGGRARMIATDGHRLSKVDRELDGLTNVPEGLSDGLIIPRKSLTELKRGVDSSLPEIRLGLSGNNAVFRFGTTTLMVRLVDSTFPDYRRVVPEQLPDNQARVATAEFTQKLKFVALFANARTSNVSLTFDGDMLELSASDPDTGEGKETMPIKYVGPKLQVGFNYRYVLDVLNVLSEAEFRFQVVDAFSAALLLDGDRDDDLFLVMPMRL